MPPSASTTASGSTTTSSTETSTATPVPTSEPPSKVVGVRVTPSVQNTSPTLTVEWQALAGGAVTYTVKYSTRPGEVNTPPEGALEVREISGTSTILTALERGTTYYIWVVGVSEGGEGSHSDMTSGVTYDGELDGTSDPSLQNWKDCERSAVYYFYTPLEYALLAYTQLKVLLRLVMYTFSSQVMGSLKWRRAPDKAVVLYLWGATLSSTPLNQGR